MIDILRCRVSWVGSLLILVSLPLLASGEELKFLHLKEGVSQSTVRSIYKDRQGFLWFATKDGLNRFDGSRITCFKPDLDNPQSIGGNIIVGMVEDRSGRLCVGTDGNGLCRMESADGRFRSFLHDAAKPDSLIGDTVKAVCLDRRGNLWVGTDRGLDCLLRGSERFIHFRPTPGRPGAVADRSVVCLAAGRDGRVWVGLNDAGLDVYDPRSGRFSHYRHDPANPRTLDNDRVRSVAVAASGFIWVGTERGLNRIDPDTFVVTRFPLGTSRMSVVNGVAFDSGGSVWASTFEDGIFLLEAPGFQLRHYQTVARDPESLSTNKLLTLYIDDADILWIGTNGFGVDRVNLGVGKFSTRVHELGNRSSLGFHSIRAIHETRNRVLYIGGYGGLDRWDRRSGEWTHFLPQAGNPHSLNSPDVYCLCPNGDDDRDLIWVGTEGMGLNVFDPVRLEARPYPIPGLVGGNVYSLAKDRSGMLWIGTNGGLHRYDIRRSRVDLFDLYGMAGLPPEAPFLEVRSLREDREGLLWVGTSRTGLFTVDRERKSVRHFFYDPHRSGSLSSNWVNCVYVSKAGELWVGTGGGGLNLMDRQAGTFAHFTSKAGLPNDVVYGILEDDGGFLWLSTNSGLSRFDPKTRSFRNYDARDGLAGNEFNGNAFHRSRWSGEMFFGGVDGLTFFLPGQVHDDPHVPAVVLTDFKIFNRSVVPGKDSPLKRHISQTEEIVLSYRDSMLTFEFNGLHYIAPEKNLYAYKMEGNDREWNYTDASRRLAIYTNLAPGRYTFRVRAANHDGVWNEKEASLRLVIVPPFWRTWWFISLGILLGSLLVFGAFQWRIRRLTRRKAELEQLVALRTEELREASLRDPLTGLRNRRFLVEILKGDIAAFVKAKKYLLDHPHRREESVVLTVFGVFMLDIDHFKTVNDLYGHEAGDNLLIRISEILQSSIRQDDVVVRMGGEEFLVILKRTDPGALGVFAKKIKDRIEASDFHLLDNPPVTLKKTCSIGFTSYPFYQDQPDWLTFEQVIGLTDMGLYYAKKSGRNAAVHVQPGGVVPEREEIGRLLSSVEESVTSHFLAVSFIK